jgi:phage gp29-like protein
MKTTTDISALIRKNSRYTDWNPIASLTPATLASWLDEFRYGYIRQASRLFQEIEERDDILVTVAGKRKSAIAGIAANWRIEVTDENDKEALAQKEKLTDFYNTLTWRNALDANQRGGIRALVKHMADAIGKQYAVHEIVWSPTRTTLTAQFNFVPLWFFDNTEGKLRFNESGFSSNSGPVTQENEWLITATDKALMKACSIAYLLKSMSIRDWAMYNEIFGIPGIIAIIDQLPNSPEWEEAKTTVSAIANEFKGVVSKGTTFETITPGGAGQAPFKDLIDRMDRAMAATWRGSDLSTLSNKDGAGASLQGDESAIYLEDDCAWISETLQEQIDKFVIRYFFGNSAEIKAYILITPESAKDQKARLEILKGAKDLGLEVSKRQAREELEIDAPADPEDSLFSAHISPSSPTADSNVQSVASANTEPQLRKLKKQLATAVASDLQPLNKRIADTLQALENITDPTIAKAYILDIFRNEQDLYEAIFENTETIKFLENTLGDAILQGATTGTPSPSSAKK